MLITVKGMIVRTAITELRIIGRATQGVRVIALKPKDTLISVARVVIDDEEDDAQPKLPMMDETDSPEATDTTEAPETPDATEAPKDGLF